MLVLHMTVYIGFISLSSESVVLFSASASSDMKGRFGTGTSGMLEHPTINNIANKNGYLLNMLGPLLFYI